MKFIISLIIALLSVGASAETLKVFAGIEGFPQKPYADWKEGKAEPAGLDSDLLRLIAKEIKVTLEFVNPVLTADTKDLRRELLERTDVNLVAYAYTVTEERKKHVTFSRPYYKSSLAALVLKDSEIECRRSRADPNGIARNVRKYREFLNLGGGRCMPLRYRPTQAEDERPSRAPRGRGEVTGGAVSDCSEERFQGAIKASQRGS